MLSEASSRVGALVAAESSALELMLRALSPWLSDSSVTELCINQPRQGFAEGREGWREVPLPFADFDWCRRLAKLVANSTRQRIDEESPLLSASLPRGERMQIVMPPATTTGLCCHHDSPALRSGLVNRGPQPKRHLPIHAQSLRKPRRHREPSS